MNEENKATEQINEILANLRTDTTYAKVLALRKLVSNSHDAPIVRVASRMLNLQERIWHDEKIKDFMKKKSKLLGKKLHELTPDEKRKIRSDFNKL